MMDLESLRARLRGAGQDHVLRWWPELSAPQQQALLNQLAAVNLDLARSLAADAAAPVAPDGQNNAPAVKALRARPPRDLIRVGHNQAERRRAVTRGQEALARGQVGAILVAGGQGTRLDFPHPKGMFPIAPISGKSLFQLLAEQLRARGDQTGRPIPYYIMTSDATHDETVAYFADQQYFGLRPDNVSFFRQGNMPAIDSRTGRLLMAEKGVLAESPDGHGGLLRALSTTGLLADMRKRGVEYLYYHQVDNPLVRVCDPEFLGWHILRDAEISTKVVAKTSPEEKMGLVVDVDGQPQIIEYSDLPPEVARKRAPDGGLLLWAGNMAVHVFSLAFLDRLVRERIDLPFHCAHKKVPYVDEDGMPVTPPTENAYKFERFIFDVLLLTQRSLVVETVRELEFNPLKNKTGDFSPPDVSHSLSRLYAGWLRAAGVAVSPEVAVEISPLFALDEDSLRSRLAREQWEVNGQGDVYLEPGKPRR